MAVFKIKNKKKNPKNIKKYLAVAILLLSCLFLFCLITNVIPFMHSFLLGTFGLFGYPMSALLFLVAVALLNNKKYSQSAKYTTFLCLTIFFLLTIIQMGVIGDKNGLSYGDHLALSYNKKITGGGIIVGFFTTSLTYVVGYVWAYVIFCVAFVTFAALFADALIHSIKKNRENSPVKISLKEVKKPEEEVNIVSKGLKITEKKMYDSKEGLVGKDPETFEQKIEAPKFDKKSILTPPEFDFDKFMQEKNDRLKQVSVSQKEIDKNISALKEESISPEKSVHIDSFSAQVKPRVRGNLPEVKPEEVVSEVDDIIKEVAKESGAEFIASDASDRDFSRDRQDFSRDREDFSRDREDFSRDRQDFSRDRQDFSRDREDFTRDRSDFTREKLEPKPEINVSQMSREKPRRFVDFDSDNDDELDKKVEEEVVPYVYSRPPIDLITTQSTDMSDLDEGIANKTIILENTLQEFGVAAKVQDVVIGPAVTRYELEMPSGVTVKKILNLSSDIALTLEANGGDVRIEAPVPGRNVVGVEVPNDKVATVSIKDVLSSQEFKNAKSPLSYAVGKDITGNIIIGDLAKAPHLLIAGTTGSGKSVMLNGIILSLIYKSSPEDVRLILVDPKQVEFKVYEGIPHLLTPRIITDVVKAGNALNWAVDEMELRYKLLSDTNSRDITDYNRTEAVISGKRKKMPYIVLIIDEFSDFMMTSKKEVEDRIVRLGQKARAAGIHMILATQRPTTESVTGGIKANFPSRIAFKVAGRVNSDVILGQTGAEKLLGKGDMLYAPIEISASPKRVQGCFVTTEEVINIVNYVSLNNEQIFDPEVQDAINNVKKSGAGGDEKAMDPLLPEALKICIDSNQASGSMIQRKLSIGFPRAGKILDQMTAFGYISAADGAKPRKVYITLEEYYKIFGGGEN